MTPRITAFLRPHFWIAPIPHPTALKIRQLKNATMAVFEKFEQVNRVCLKS